MIKVDKKIVGCSVVSKDTDTLAEQEALAAPPSEVMSETYKRPDMANGSTYRIKTPLFDSAMYITINDVILNPGTPQEHIRPLEMFINSKEMSQFQWIVALTRIISAVFRKGGDVTFLVEELKSVFDPKGGYFKKGKYIPSLVAEIGGVLEQHLISRGIMEPETLDAATKDYIEKKKQEIRVKAEHASVKESEEAEGSTTTEEEAEDSDGFPDTATLCAKCMAKAVVILDGCATCLNCSDSKCG